MSRPFSRRSLLGTAVRGLPALAVGGSLFGRSLGLLAAPKAVDDGKIGSHEGETTLVTDFVMPPHLRIIAESTLKKLRAAFAHAAANPGKKLTKGKLTGISQRFMSAQKTARVTRAKTRATALIGNATKAKAVFGGWAAVDTAAWEADRGLDVVMKRQLTEVGWADLQQKTKQVKIKRNKEKRQIPDGYTLKPLYKKLEFHLNNVSCIRETSGESGSDEILLGGQLVRPDGIIKQIDSFKVSDDFDEGEVRRYDSQECIGIPPVMRQSHDAANICNGHHGDPYRGKVLVRTNLDGPWPGTYGLMLLMVEQDFGGFGTFLSELYEQTKDEIDRGVGAASSEAGHAISDDEMGEVIGQIIAWVVSEFIEWLANLFDNPDDQVASKSWVLTLENRTKEWFDARTAGGLSAPSGERASKMKAIDFKGDGGKYRARLHFRALS